VYRRINFPCDDDYEGTEGPIENRDIIISQQDPFHDLIIMPHRCVCMPVCFLLMWFISTRRGFSWDKMVLTSLD